MRKACDEAHRLPGMEFVNHDRGISNRHVQHRDPRVTT
jgi:hypothetical protein